MALDLKCEYLIRYFFHKNQRSGFSPLLEMNEIVNDDCEKPYKTV